MDSLQIDVVVPVWNSLDWLPDCIGALREQTQPPTTIVAVDDGSSDGSVAWLHQHAPEVRVLTSSKNCGFAATVNRGILEGSSPWVALLNTDTVVQPDWLEELSRAAAAAPSEVGSLASLMLQLASPELVDNAGDSFSRYGSARKDHHGCPLAEVSLNPSPMGASAGAALYRRAMLDRIGLFDEGFESYLEDVDLALRAQTRGYSCRLVPKARVLHASGGSKLSRRRYVRLTTANRVSVLLKNFPWSVLARCLPKIIWGQFYFFVALRHPLQFTQGLLRSAARLPATLRARNDIQKQRQISAERFLELLAPELGEPSLLALAKQRLSAR